MPKVGVVLDEKDMELPTGQFEVVPLSLSVPDGVFYTYFKIVVEELRGGWGEYCQMDEFRFKDFTVDTSAYDGVITSAKSFDTSNADTALQDEYAALVGTR